MVELAPDKASSYAHRAELYEVRGELAKAITDLSKAIAMEPQDTHYLVRRGKLFEAAGYVDRASADFATAIELLSKRLETDAPNTGDILDRAEAFEAKGDAERAMLDASKVIDKQPDWRTPYELRARLHERKGDHQAMVADYEKVMALLRPPKTPREFSEWARIYLLAGQAATGLENAELSLEMQPDVAAVLDIRGRLLEALGRREEAIADFRRALAKRPDLATSRHGLKRFGVEP